jgi:type III pantothenate kinase
MILVIDSGNTNIVFAIFDDTGNIKGKWRISSSGNRTADEYGVWLNQLIKLSNIQKNQISKSIIATVVPATLFALKMLCRNYFNSTPLVVGDKDVYLGLKICVDNPEEVGADRIANAIAAQKYHKLPLIIIDFGTATTFDVIDKNGSYEGGIIAPGINLSLESLHQNAAQLPRIAISKPTRVLGKSTLEAMRSGVFWGYIALIEGLVKRIQRELNQEEFNVIATGGLSPLFEKHCEVIEKSDEDLTLFGLYLIYQRNINCR